MNTQEVLDLIRDSLTKFTALKKEAVQLTSSLSADLGLDSQEELELVFELEDQLKIKLPPDDYAECETIQDVVSLVQRVQAA
ncbi:MAG: phosphopantetheine-binding protein [Tumebacillaceae bacterium]